jgi:hypothetical protein
VGGQSTDDPFKICILGDDPSGATLDQMVEGELANGRKITIQRIHELPKACRVLFVSKSEKEIGPVLAELSTGCLTVGESSDFLKAGGVIAFALENRRVRFDINLHAVSKYALQISSKLLNVARTVEK